MGSICEKNLNPQLYIETQLGTKSSLKVRFIQIYKCFALENLRKIHRNNQYLLFDSLFNIPYCECVPNPPWFDYPLNFSYFECAPTPHSVTIPLITPYCTCVPPSPWRDCPFNLPVMCVYPPTPAGVIIPLNSPTLSKSPLL